MEGRLGFSSKELSREDLKEVLRKLLCVRMGGVPVMSVSMGGLVDCESCSAALRS